MRLLSSGFFGFLYLGLAASYVWLAAVLPSFVARKRFARQSFVACSLQCRLSTKGSGEASPIYFDRLPPLSWKVRIAPGRRIWLVQQSTID